MNDISLAPPDKRLSPAAVLTTCTGVIFLVVGLIFGARDTWVSARGVNASIADGLSVGLFTLIPIASVVLCVAVSHWQGRSRSSTFVRGGVVAIAVGAPMALFLAIAAAY